MAAMEQFEQFLRTHLPKVEGFHPHYEAALHAMLLAGGKRFRPALLLSVVRAYNTLLIPNAYYAAYALELLHTYSLIHDDLPLMDNADLRRGQPTLHVQYNDVTAVLVGDALNTYAFEVLTGAPFSDRIRVKLIRELAHNGGLHGMVLGQIIDCHFENQPLTLDEIKLLHINKTAKLIAASLKMGAIIVGEETVATKLYDFGLTLGLLFQVQDDILDVTQSVQEAGKPINNDGDKNGFVTLLGLSEALQKADMLAADLFQQMQTFETSLQHELDALLRHYINRHKD